MKVHPATTAAYQSTPSPDVPRLAKQLKSQIDTFTTQLQSLMSAPEQSEDPTFLTSLKNNIVALAETSKQINGE